MLAVDSWRRLVHRISVETNVLCGATVSMFSTVLEVVLEVGHHQFTMVRRRPSLARPTRNRTAMPLAVLGPRLGGVAVLVLCIGGEIR